MADEVRAGLKVRLLADKKNLKYNRDTGQPEFEFLGLKIEGPVPRIARVPTSWVDRGRNEGWITVEGENIVHRPGGPATNPYNITHTFKHCDTIILHTVDGDVRYTVTHQPDKYAEGGDDDTPVTDDIYLSGNTRVDWFYDIDLED